MDERLAYELAQRVTSLFSLPPPRIVVSPNLPEPGLYSLRDKTIYLRPDADERVLLHEVAHYIHDAYGVRAPTRALEAWASVFEEVMARRAASYPYRCPSCSMPLVPYGGPCVFCGYGGARLLPCPNCGAPVKPGGRCPECGLSYPSPSVLLPALGSTIIMTGIYALAKGYLPPKGREQVLDLLRFAGASFLSAALAAALA